MRRLYAPRNYYRRIHAFLQSFEPQGPRRGLSSRREGVSDVALVLGVWHPDEGATGGSSGRRCSQAHGSCRTAIELSILGYHFRKVARSL